MAFTANPDEQFKRMLPDELPDALEFSGGIFPVRARCTPCMIDALDKAPGALQAGVAFPLVAETHGGRDLGGIENAMGGERND